MMKSKFALLLLMLPLALMAQSKKMTVEKFYEKYSEYPNYSSMEVTEDMFKLFKGVNDAEPQTVEFLKKLKLVRMLEFNPSYVTTVSGISGGKNHTGSSSTGIATGTTVEIEGKRISESVVYKMALDELDFSGYIKLLKSVQDGEKMILLKRSFGEKNKEFLLISGNMLIQVRGDINISHLYQMDEIMSAIGEILPQ